MDVVFFLAFNTFLIFARRMELRLISLDVPEINDVAIPLSNLSGAVAVDTYADTESVFWTDKFEDTISTAQLDVSTIDFLVCFKHKLICGLYTLPSMACTSP